MYIYIKGTGFNDTVVLYTTSGGRQIWEKQPVEKEHICPVNSSIIKKGDDAYRVIFSDYNTEERISPEGIEYLKLTHYFGFDTIDIDSLLD